MNTDFRTWPVMEKVLFLFAGILVNLNARNVLISRIYFDETTEVTRACFTVGSARHGLVLFPGPRIRLMMDGVEIATISPERKNANRARTHFIQAIKASLP